MKVSDLIEDLETGDRTMEQLKTKASPPEQTFLTGALLSSPIQAGQPSSLASHLQGLGGLQAFQNPYSYQQQARHF